MMSSQVSSRYLHALAPIVFGSMNMIEHISTFLSFLQTFPPQVQDYAHPPSTSTLQPSLLVLHGIVLIPPRPPSSTHHVRVLGTAGLWGEVGGGRDGVEGPSAGAGGGPNIFTTRESRN
jgi:hypothetical protein